MDPISQDEIRRRIEHDNPWWTPNPRGVPEAAHQRRVYFSSFKSLALNFDIKRAVVLLGPRRVGKTVMVKQLVYDAVIAGVSPKGILYASIDAPIYSGISLERFLGFFPADAPTDKRLVIFDEIQYLKNWENHLKDLVDSYPTTKFVVTGSAAASLKLRSRESGAGRFTEFMLPPLTFYEFLSFTGNNDTLIEQVDIYKYRTPKIDDLNEVFIDYLNYGGYPEAVLNPQIRLNSDQFIRNDIIDKVLLKDLPSLYGINEIQELNKLFSVLAYNAGNEASLENISKNSGLAKPTIRKYIEYLESAFLIMKLPMVDENCRQMTRERTFKVYLNNPSMRAALFSPVTAADTDRIGFLAESAIFSQWQHSPGFQKLRYARWRNEGEIDIIYLHGPKNTPHWIGEIKWTDRVANQFGEETRSIQTFLKKHKSITGVIFTTKTLNAPFTVEGKAVNVYPCSLYCYTIGRNITSSLEKMGKLGQSEPDQEVS